MFIRTNKNKNKYERHRKEPSSPFKESSMEFGLNFILRNTLSFIIFGFLYQPIFQVSFEIPTQISYIIFFSGISSILAMFSSYLLLNLLLFRRQRRKRSFFKLNRIFNTKNLMWEILSQLINAIFISFGIRVFLEIYAENYLQFIMFYVIFKLIASLIAYNLAEAILDNILLVFFFVFVYLSMLYIAFYSLMNIIEVIELEEVITNG